METGLRISEDGNSNAEKEGREGINHPEDL
jgi:hypothetical protein